jgi:hypothetical protein
MRQADCNMNVVASVLAWCSSCCQGGLSCHVPFLKLLQTFSNHQTLPEPAKTQFFQGMAAELARFGNVVTRHYETLLLVAHKADVNHCRGDQRDE